MLERDQLVLSCVRNRERRLPLVITLAGGYGLNAWRYSARFFSFLLNRGRAIEPPTTEEAVLSRYRGWPGARAARLTGEPESEDDWGLTAEDLAGSLGGPRRPPRFLGYYSRQGLELALERAGLLDRLRGLGFEQPVPGDGPRQPDRRHLAPLRRPQAAGAADRAAGADRPRSPSRLRVAAHRVAPAPEPARRSSPPTGRACRVRPIPASGCSRTSSPSWCWPATACSSTALLFVPAHYHTASQGRKNLRFLDPADEGLFRALCETFHGLPLAEATRAVDEGRVVDARTGEPFTWRPVPMVLPVTESLRDRVEGEEYERQVAEAQARYAFALR